MPGPVELKIGGRARGGLGGPGPGNPGNVGRGLQAVSGAIEGVADVIFANQENRDRVTATRLQGEYRRDFDEAAAKIDPLAKDYQQQVSELANGLRTDLSETAEFHTRTIQDRFSTAMEATVQGDLASAAQLNRGAIQTEAVTERGRLENEVLAQIRSDPDFASGYLKAFSASAETLAPAISPEVLRKMSEKFVDATVTAQVEGLALSGRIEEANAALKEQQDILRPDHVRRLAGRIIEIQNRGVAASRAKVQVAVANIKVAVTDAEDTGALDVQRKEVEDMDENDEFPGPLQQTRAQLIAAIEAKRDALLSGSNKLANAQRQRDAGVLHKQSDVDLVYKNEQGQLPTGPDGQVSVEQALNHLVTFAAETGRMPSEQKAFIKNAEKGDSVEQMAAAAKVDRDIRAVADNVDTGAGPRLKRVEAYMDLHGLDAVTAARRVLDNVPDRATLKQRQDAYMDGIGAAFDDDVDDFLQTDVANRGLLVELFTSEPEVSPELRDRASRLFRLSYEQSGDADIAKEETKKLLQKETGMTEVGRATKQMVSFPVERFYFPPEFAKELQEDPDTKVRIINSVIEGALEEMGIDMPTPPAGLEDQSRYELLADADTKRDMAQGKQASWEVRIRDAQGSLVPIWIEENGRRFKARIIAPTPDELRNTPIVQEITSERIAAAELGAARLSAKPAASLAEAQDRFPFKIPSKGGKAQSIFFSKPVEASAVVEPEARATKTGIGDAKRAPAPVPNPVEVQASISKVAAAPEAPVHMQKKMQAIRGIGNNNPGNLQPIKGVTWQGQAAKQTDKRFLTFSDAKSGIRALSRDLRVKTDRGQNTITLIVAGDEKQDFKGYAPAFENDTVAYIKSVSKRAGFGATQVLNLDDEVAMRKIVKAIIHHENGVQPYPEELLGEAIVSSRREGRSGIPARALEE